jgi:hypothetical protein
VTGAHIEVIEEIINTLTHAHNRDFTIFIGSCTDSAKLLEHQSLVREEKLSKGKHFQALGLEVHHRHHHFQRRGAL